jgi:hypothetical protein
MKFKTAAGIAFVLSGACAIAASALDREIPGSHGTTFAAIGASINNGVSFVPSGAFTALPPALGSASFTGVGEAYARNAIVPSTQDLVAPAPAPVAALTVGSDKARNVRRAYQTGTYNPAARHRIEMIADSYIAYLDRRAREPVTPRYDVSHVRARRASSQNGNNVTRHAYEN